VDGLLAFVYPLTKQIDEISFLNKNNIANTKRRTSGQKIQDKYKSTTELVYGIEYCNTLLDYAYVV